MTIMAEKTAELRRITRDLEAYLDTYCAPAVAADRNPADQACHDAAVLLRDALSDLGREERRP